MGNFPKRFHTSLKLFLFEIWGGLDHKFRLWRKEQIKTFATDVFKHHCMNHWHSVQILRFQRVFSTVLASFSWFLISSPTCTQPDGFTESRPSRWLYLYRTWVRGVSHSFNDIDSMTDLWMFDCHVEYPVFWKTLSWVDFFVVCQGWENSSTKKNKIIPFRISWHFDSEQIPDTVSAVIAVDIKLILWELTPEN